MDIVVSGIGLVSTLGTLTPTWKHLLAGRSGIQCQQPFSALPPRPLALVGAVPTDLVSLTCQVVTEALQDAGLASPLVDCGVVVGSSRGNQAAWERLALGISAASGPLPPISTWLDTLPHAAAIATAQLIGTTAPVLSPMSACATGIWSIARGCELLRRGDCQRVIAGAIEAPITPLTLTGFERMGALASAGAYPFDQAREGLVLGEGGAVLVLETAELAIQRGAKIYGRILDYGLTADAFHVSAPEPDSRAAIAAVQQCLQRSGLSPQDIHYIHAHGTATVLNDRNEAHLIQTLFPAAVPISSTKGATGHTIGASGALGVAFSLLALRQQLLPPCTGLCHADFDLNFVRETHPAHLDYALCLSFGFGGQNAAIALAK